MKENDETVFGLKAKEENFSRSLSEKRSLGVLSRGESGVMTKSLWWVVVVVTHAKLGAPDLTSHHFHKFVKVNRAGPVRVDLLDHHVQIVVGQLIVQLPQDLAQAAGGDEAVTFLVVQTERLPEFLLQGLLVLLNDELGRERHELGELDLTGTILVDLLDHLLEDLAVEGLAHQPEDFGHRLGRDAASLVAVEAVEGLLQDGNLLWWEIIHCWLLLIGLRGLHEEQKGKTIRKSIITVHTTQH